MIIYNGNEISYEKERRLEEVAENVAKDLEKFLSKLLEEDKDDGTNKNDSRIIF